MPTTLLNGPIIVLAPRAFEIFWVFVFFLRGLTVLMMAQLLFYYNFVRQESIGQRMWVRETSVPSPLASTNTMVIQVVVMVVHLYKLQVMVVASNDRRQLMFRANAHCPEQRASGTVPHLVHWMDFVYESHEPHQHPVVLTRMKRLVKLGRLYATKIIQTAMLPFRVFEIDHEWFDEVFAARETIELVSQAGQVARITLMGQSEFFITASVLAVFANCVSTLVLEKLSAKYNVSTNLTRLLLLITDAILDFTFATGIPLAMVSMYLLQFDPVHEAYGAAYLDDRFVTKLSSVAQFVTWSTTNDIFFALVFHAGFIISLEYAQALVERESESEVGSPPRSRLSSNQGDFRCFASESLIKPTARQQEDVSPPDRSAGNHDAITVGPISSYHSSSLTIKQASRPLIQHNRGALRRQCLQMMSYLHALLGFAVLGASMHARFFAAPVVTNCKQPAYQWFSRRQPCLILEVNCYRRHIAGNSEDMTAAFREILPGYLKLLVVSHCPALIIPEGIRDFHGLHTVEIYNSTLLEWPRSAGLEAWSNPAITCLRFISVNFSNGQLPVGTHPVSMSSSLGIVYIMETNLKELPDDLHESWRNLDILFLSASQLQQFPQTITSMSTLTFLALETQPIQEIPSGALDHMELLLLSLAGTPIEKIPDSLPLMVLQKSCHVDLVRTSIHTLPDWLETVLRANQNASALVCFIGLYQSPICSNRATRALLHRDLPVSSLKWLLTTCFKDDDKTSYGVLITESIRKQRVL